MSKFKERESSSIYNIRIFHNWVKRELIKQSCDHLRENYNITDITLLDIACGKGGDMAKYIDNGIMNVIGFDIDAKSIEEAKRRYNDILKQLRRKNVKKLPNYKFYVMDLSDKKNLDEIRRIIGGIRFDIVSCQFAIHYFFKSEEILNTFMTIVSSYIKNNGFFIGTTMNGDNIKDIFKKSGNVIQNSIFKIVNNTDIKDINNSYNNKYSVSLGKDTDTEHYFAGKISEEYLVNIEELKKISNKFNLMFIGTTEFSDWYKSFNKNNLSNEEKEFSFLNFTFVFTPVRNN